MHTNLIGACDFNLSLPHGGLLYNDSSISSSDRVVPSGEQLWFGCAPGFYPREPVVSICQEDGLWYPDPSQMVCQSKRFAYSMPCSTSIHAASFP
jgi:hypothetical protein